MQRYNINWTAKALANQMEKGKVNYDNAGSAKPTSVQTRRDVMRSLLPMTDKVEESNPGKSDPDDMDNSEQFEEENYEP